eukprot:scaffold67092_cov61-Phaeocystis_antarctica.AAC.6
MAPPVAQHLRSISGVHRAASGSTGLVRVRGLGLRLDEPGLPQGDECHEVAARHAWLGLRLGLGLGLGELSHCPHRTRASRGGF